VQQIKYTVSRELFDFPWYPKVIKSLESCLTLIIFHHVSLPICCEILIVGERRYTDTLQSDTCMNFIDLHGKFIFDALHLEANFKKGTPPKMTIKEKKSNDAL
jgi:hypothetical protein